MDIFKKHHSEFEQLTLTLGPQLFRLAFWRLHNKEDAEDAVQSTYLRAYRSFHTYKPGSNIKAWMTKILVNVINDRISQTKREPALENFDENVEEIEMQPALSRAQQDPLKQLEQTEIDCGLLYALKTLPA